jgi:hypothetical protein
MDVVVVVVVVVGLIGCCCWLGLAWLGLVGWLMVVCYCYCCHLL